MELYKAQANLKSKQDSKELLLGKKIRVSNEVSYIIKDARSISYRPVVLIFKTNLAITIFKRKEIPIVHEIVLDLMIPEVDLGLLQHLRWSFLW